MANSGVPTLLCPPLALHGAAIADLAPGYSLVSALRGAGIERLFMADWRSASPEMRYLGIDDYLADLNILVDELGGLVDLVGLCQGGWLSLVYAGRFPGKVRKLAMAGAPIDITARQSTLSAIAEATPMAVFQGLVDLGGGRVIGRDVASFWGNNATDANEIRRALQTPLPVGSEEFERLEIELQEMEFLDHQCSRQILSRSHRETVQAQRTCQGESLLRWDKPSTFRSCGFQFTFLPAATTTWSHRNNCWHWSGWQE